MLNALVLGALLQLPEAPEVPNATLRHMFEHRAEVQRTQRSAALLLGGAMLAGGLLTGLFVRSADARTQAIGLPWAIEADLLGSAMLFAGLMSTGRELEERASRLQPGGSTPLSALLDEERRSFQFSGGGLAATLGVGVGLAALGTGLVTGGRFTTGTDSAALSSAGAAVLSLGVLVAALGVFLWNEARLYRAQLDRGIVEDLELVQAHDVEADTPAGR